MDYIADEIEGSQRRGVLNSGCGTTPEYLTTLKKKINLVMEIARQYRNMTITILEPKTYFVRYLVKLIRCTNKLLPTYIGELKQGRRLEAFCITSGVHRPDIFWDWCNNICRDMQGQTVYQDLRENLDQLKALLLEVENVLMHSEPTMFEKFFHREKQRYPSTGVEHRFETWLYDNNYPGIERLRELQALVVAETLKKGVLDYADVSSQKELDEVRLDYLKSLLPCDFETDDDFKMACAKWRRFIHWEGTILVIDYKKYGKYIQAHFYDFSEEQLQAIFELDMMLKLIHKEMGRLKPINEEKLTENRKPNEELFKFIHPAICGGEEWNIHEEIKRLVRNHGIPEICDYLYQMSKEKKLLLPKMSSVAYQELVRMGMPKKAGYGEKNLNKYYKK